MHITKANNQTVIVHLNSKILFFLLFIFPDLIFFLYFFNNEEVCDHGHIIYHITLYHMHKM